MNQAQASTAALEVLFHLNCKILQSSRTTLPQYCRTAKPYLRAIADNNYGLEDPTMCVLYALNNLIQWRGEDARRLKLQLKTSINQQP